MATDYDCWHDGHDDVSVEAVVQIIQQNVSNARDVIRAVAPRIAAGPRCRYADALRGAIMTAPDAIGPEVRDRLGLLIDRHLPA
jgi:5'-methylthioadenosine phosphorylase